MINNSPKPLAFLQQDEWTKRISEYAHIVLVANSDAVNVDELRAAYPESTLFAFFNRADKVLKAPFDAPAVLISRAQPKGANIVYREEVSKIINLFSSRSFLGIVNVRYSHSERLNTKADYHNALSGQFDLSGYCDAFYPRDRVPTSGFAFALWLSEQAIPTKIVLAGFTGQRSDKWRVVSAHDWTFEQIFLRLMVKQGKIAMHGGMAHSGYEVLLERFPEFSATQISATVAEVLSSRLNATEKQVDKLISLTGAFRWFDTSLRGLRPSFLRKKPKGK
ncbi:3-deoxy-manno-octulosonate cytidylyltransferase [Neorhizobium sp. NPDC001467]|uniref:3-deoxy-manno-octulosonate cytidylyltransferase n=1 Tax=Neorhizobium sp. NPDC001467 TaxID=3390595 RepID=UPI003D076720